MMSSLILGGIAVLEIFTDLFFQEGSAKTTF